MNDERAVVEHHVGDDRADDALAALAVVDAEVALGVQHAALVGAERLHFADQSPTRSSTAWCRSGTTSASGKLSAKRLTSTPSAP